MSALDAKRFLQARCVVYSRPMQPEEVCAYIDETSILSETVRCAVTS